MHPSWSWYSVLDQLIHTVFYLHTTVIRYTGIMPRYNFTNLPDIETPCNFLIYREFPLGRTSWQDGKPTARHKRHWPRQEQASPFVPNHGFRNMHDSGLSSQSQKCHKLDVIVFVPVALNQFLNRPLFCVGKIV